MWRGIKLGEVIRGLCLPHPTNAYYRTVKPKSKRRILSTTMRHNFWRFRGVKKVPQEGKLKGESRLFGSSPKTIQWNYGL
ncbi:hypothetical protein CH359_19000 [Leptospira meyeri]|nr:hypothetical protein CH359_19000 [Leptospira meyeri]PJZ95096.1 hypothetical protein CH358_18960 [Leptospira meyeri]